VFDDVNCFILLVIIFFEKAYFHIQLKNCRESYVGLGGRQIYNELFLSAYLSVIIVEQIILLLAIITDASTWSL